MSKQLQTRFHSSLPYLEEFIDMVFYLSLDLRDNGAYFTDHAGSNTVTYSQVPKTSKISNKFITLMFCQSKLKVFDVFATFESLETK